MGWIYDQWKILFYIREIKYELFLIIIFNYRVKFKFLENIIKLFLKVQQNFDNGINIFVFNYIGLF